MKRVSLIVSILCYLAIATQANPALFADSDNASVEELAALVCKTTRGTKHQIGHLSSFAAIAEFLSGLTDSHKLFDCRNKYLDSLHELIRVVETASENVCGEEKLALIEDFHHKFVSKTRKDLKIQKKGSKAPRMAKLFFMQYATEVSSACEQSLLASVAGKEHSISAEDTSQVENLKKFTEILGMSDLSKGYKSIYLLWNLIDSLNPSEMYKVSKYIAPSGDVRVNFQMKDARPIAGLQAVCRYRLKPVYSRTILPVLRLIDLGYYPQSKRLLESIKSDLEIKNLFYGAQICESLLPVGMFSNDQLDSNQFVALTNEEASQLNPPKLEDVESLIENVPSSDVAPVAVSGQQLIADGTPVEEIKLNVANRGKVMGRLLRQIWNQVKTQFKTAVKGFKMFRKNKDQKLEVVDEDALKRIEKESPALRFNEEEEEQTEEGSLARTKRESCKFTYDSWPWYEKIAFTIATILGFIYLVILYAIKVALFGLPTLIAFIVKRNALPDDKVRQFVNWLWRIGNPLYRNAGFTSMFPYSKKDCCGRSNSY